MKPPFWIALLCLIAGACTEAAQGQTNPPRLTQRGEGQAYEIIGSEVWDVPDPVSGRDYQVFVQLPPTYATERQRRYPVLFVTDADYAFPIIRQISRRVNLNGPVIEEFILVGLSYSKGDDGVVSRNRDYTPTPNGPRRASSTLHGGGAAYQAYLKAEVLPFIESRFRADPARRLLLGHSYGGLLGAQIMFTDPGLFSGYALGSPSLWFDRRHVFRMEAGYAQAHDDLTAEVFLYIGDLETPGPTARHTNDVDMVGDVRSFEAVLKGRNYPGLKIRSAVLAAEDHLTVAPRGFTHALMALLPARSERH